ncbi:MAG: hypothetical protein Q9218_006736 [Villophora microphyllina]
MQAFKASMRSLRGHGPFAAHPSSPLRSSALNRSLPLKSVQTSKLLHSLPRTGTYSFLHGSHLYHTQPNTEVIATPHLRGPHIRGDYTNFEKEDLNPQPGDPAPESSSDESQAAGGDEPENDDTTLPSNAQSHTLDTLHSRFDTIVDWYLGMVKLYKEHPVALVKAKIESLEASLKAHTEWGITCDEALELEKEIEKMEKDALHLERWIGALEPEDGAQAAGGDEPADNNTTLPSKAQLHKSVALRFSRSDRMFPLYIALERTIENHLARYEALTPDDKEIIDKLDEPRTHMKSLIEMETLKARMDLCMEGAMTRYEELGLKEDIDNFVKNVLHLDRWEEPEAGKLYCTVDESTGVRTWYG